MGFILYYKGIAQNNTYFSCTGFQLNVQKKSRLDLRLIIGPHVAISLPKFFVTENTHLKMRRK